MERLSYDAWALENATEELRGDREVVMRAVSVNGHALYHAAEELRGDREVVMKAVSQDGYALMHAAEELRGDREVVMKAVSQDGYALHHAAEELKGDQEVVMKAVSQQGYALKYATEELRGDQEIIEVALAKAPDGVVLSVRLLSGKCCKQIFPWDWPVDTVLYECAKLLDLDPRQVANSGTLIFGTAAIEDLSSLEVGKVHELTLVIS